MKRVSDSRAQERADLEDGATEFGVELDADRVDRLIDYLDLLYLWNRTAGLTRVQRRDAVRLHIIDSLSAVPYLRSSVHVVDLGSGAGLPGIPLAAALRGAEVTLVESRRKKCSFLEESIRTLGLDNCTVLEEDAGILAASGRQFEAVISRAFRPPTDLVRFASPMVSSGGLLVLMGGREMPDGLRLAASGQDDLELTFEQRFKLPRGGEIRTLVGLRRPA